MTYLEPDWSANQNRENLKSLKSIHKTQKLGFWIKHIYIMWYRWRHWGQYLTSNWPQIDLSIGKSIRQLKKYILLFYSSTLIELNIHLVRINHFWWRHHDVIRLFLVKYDQTDHFWSKMTKKNPEIKSWNTKIQQTAIIWQIFRWNSSFLVDFHAKNNQKWTQFFSQKCHFHLKIYILWLWNAIFDNYLNNFGWWNCHFHSKI